MSLEAFVPEQPRSPRYVDEAKFLLSEGVVARFLARRPRSGVLIRRIDRLADETGIPETQVGYKIHATNKGVFTIFLTEVQRLRSLALANSDELTQEKYGDLGEDVRNADKKEQEIVARILAERKRRGEVA